jgi:hypothetical protein
MARKLDVPVHWLYQRIEHGAIVVPFDSDRKLYLFPDTSEALALLRRLKEGRIKNVRL